jgi:hypothetical protein
VEAAFIDPKFIGALASLPKLGEPQLLDQRDDGDLVLQRVRYRFVGELSGAVRRVVDPARLTWVEASKLDRRSHVTTLQILPDNYANLLSASATISLTTRSDGAACSRTTVGDVAVRVPLVGRRVEAAIISGLREHAEAEIAALDRWLSGSG